MLFYEKENLTMILNDGTEIKNIKISGNTYCSDKKIDESLLRQNTQKVIIKDDEEETILRNVIFDYQEYVENEDIWFIFFHEKNESDGEKALTKLEYLAMMLDIDLDDL